MWVPVTSDNAQSAGRCGGRERAVRARGARATQAAFRASRARRVTIGAMVTSSGILLYRYRDGALEVLLAHPGGPYWSRQDHGSWSVPKGLAEGDEPFEAVAVREFGEETGFELRAVAARPDEPKV